MAKKVVTRNYPMSDGDLKQKADSLTGNLNRDAANFATRGVTNATILNYKSLITSFDDTPTDEELQGPVMDATLQKDTAANALRMSIRTVRNMAENKFKGEGFYHSFGFEDMADMSDNDLYRLGKRVGRVANTLLSQLASEGLTAAMITTINTQTTALDNAIDAQHAAIENRDIATQDRIIKGNTLWDEMTRLASIGKSIFVDVDEAKYNDYVLIDTPSGNGGNQPPPVNP